MIGTPEQIFAARGAWLAARASHEVHRLEVIKLWLEYLELADPVKAPTGDRYHGRKSCGMHLSAIIRELLQLRYVALIKIARLSDAPGVVNCAAKYYRNS
jgi:hypothetical protein